MSAIVLNNDERIEVKSWAMNYLHNVAEITNLYEGWKTYEPTPRRWQVQVVTDKKIPHRYRYKLELTDSKGNMFILCDASLSPYKGQKKVGHKMCDIRTFYGNGD